MLLVQSRKGWYNEKINKRTSGDHPNYNIINISQNTEKSPGDLKRLAVTQTPVRNHRLTLVWKTRKWIIIIITITKERKIDIIAYTDPFSLKRVCNMLAFFLTSVILTKLSFPDLIRGSRRSPRPPVLNQHIVGPCGVDSFTFLLL